MTRTVLRTIGAAAVATTALAGCASMFLHGARMADEGTPTNGSIANYTMPSCTGNDGSAIAAPALTYHLLEGASGPELFERSADGSGAIIENRWQDADGLHFYAWVTSNGWEYVLPGPGAQGIRRVYINASAQQQTDGTTRPTSAVSATCVLAPATM